MFLNQQLESEQTFKKLPISRSEKKCVLLVLKVEQSGMQSLLLGQTITLQFGLAVLSNESLPYFQEPTTKNHLRNGTELANLRNCKQTLYNCIFSIALLVRPWFFPPSLGIYPQLLCPIYFKSLNGGDFSFLVFSMCAKLY